MHTTLAITISAVSSSSLLASILPTTTVTSTALATSTLATATTAIHTSAALTAATSALSPIARAAACISIIAFHVVAVVIFHNWIVFVVDLVDVLRDGGGLGSAAAGQER